MNNKIDSQMMINTIGKVILKRHNIVNIANQTEGLYTVDILNSIKNYKINVDVKFKNSGNIIELKKTKIRNITIKENGFNIHFDNLISQNNSSINQIISIVNSSEDGLRQDIEKVKKLIDNTSDEEKDKIIKLFDAVTPTMDIFEF